MSSSQNGAAGLSRNVPEIILGNAVQNTPKCTFEP